MFYHSRMETQEQVLVERTTKINRIVMQGFKSFAKHTVFEFGDHYNCVLGPNGSGKSNVLDALCFVLGKSSSKSLRAEKSANLIYNGGKSKKPAKQGEVSIYFDNETKLFPVEEKEVKITRIVRHTGQSIYKINDQTRTRQEVVDMLAIARVNPDGYNIILQGDIVAFVEMHPDKRRELIGEIAGISVYEEKKKKALSELEKVGERLKETEIVLAERESYLKELKKDRDQALKYKEMNDKIKTYNASYLQIRIDKKKAEQEELDQKFETANKELAQLNEKIAALRKDNEQKRSEIDAITKEIEEKGEVEQVKLNKEVEHLKIELTKKQHRLETVRSELNKIEQRRNDLKQNMREVDRSLEQLQQDKKTKEQEITDKKEERVLIENKIKQFREKHNIENVSELEQQIEELDKKADDIQKDVHKAREEQHELIREKDKISHDLASIQAQLDKVADVEQEHQQQLTDLKNKKAEFKKITLDLNKVLEDDATVAAQLTTARRKYVEADEKLSKLRARQVSVKEMQFSDAALKKILQMQKSKPGIYGTVADLGNVDSKYSLALEIAAGNKLKSVVVDSDKTAAECINYLKSNKLGVATFLPLNKLKTKPVDNAVKKLAESRGAHGLAIDLISFDSKFKNVYEYVFSNAIVVDSIDVARRIGVGKAKFVTLDGDVANRAGVMQGGYRLKRKHSLGFKEQDIQKELEKAEESVAGLQNTISVLEKQRAEHEGTITEQRTAKATREGEIIKLEKSLHLETGDIEASRDKIATLEALDKETDTKINLVQEKISTLNSELASVKIERQKLRADISQLSNPTLIAELNAFEEKLKQLNEHIISIDSHIKASDSQSERVYASEKEKTEKILKDLDKEQAQFSEELKQVDQESKDIEQDLNKKEVLAQEFYAQFKGLFQKRSDIDKAIQTNDVTISSTLDKSRKVEVNANTLSLKHAESKSILAGLEVEFQQYEGVKLELEKSEEELKREIRKFEQMREQIGTVNMRALEIYDDVEKQYNELVEKKDSLSKEKEDVLLLMEEIEGKKKELFMKVFDVVNDNFKKFFHMISTKGGEAELVIEDPINPFEAGVRINVKISGSKFLDIRSLSGGEKTMTALAFIFAIQEHEPASFYVLDEVDAALDKHNSEKFADLIGKYADRAQYIIISHNDQVISHADRLYGVSMDHHGMTKVVSLKV